MTVRLAEEEEASSFTSSFKRATVGGAHQSAVPEGRGNALISATCCFLGPQTDHRLDAVTLSDCVSAGVVSMLGPPGHLGGFTQDHQGTAAEETEEEKQTKPEISV